MQGSKADQQHRADRGGSRGRDGRLKDNWISESGCICAVTKTCAKKACHVWALSLRARQPLDWSAQTANTHSMLAQTHFIYNAWGINTLRPRWWTVGPSSRMSGGGRKRRRTSSLRPFLRRVLTSVRNKLSQRAAMSSSVFWRSVRAKTDLIRNKLKGESSLNSPWKAH